MGIFDFLSGTNSNVDPGGYAGPQNKADASFNSGGIGAKTMDLFSDPNFIRMLGETGAAMSGKGSIGEAVGQGASDLVQRRAIQEGASQLRKDSEDKQQSLFEKLFSDPRSLIGPKEDNNTADSINFADDKITMGFSNAPQKQGFTRQQSLEAVKRPSVGGDDLPNFSTQPGEEAFDFAGLDSEDISMLLQAEQQFGELDQRQMKMVLDEKDKRKAAFLSSKTREENLKIAAEERLAKSMKEKRDSVAKIEAKELEVEEKKSAAKLFADSKLALEKRTTDLKLKENKLTPNELKTENLELRKLEQEVENLESGIGTPAQKAAKEKQDAEIVRKETELGMKLDVREKSELASVQSEYVDKDGITQKVDFKEREVNAIQANHRANNKVYYRIMQPIVTGWGDGKSDQPGSVTPVFLPEINEIQITSQDIIDTIGTPNPKTGKAFTEEEVLTNIAILSRQGG